MNALLFPKVRDRQHLAAVPGTVTMIRRQKTFLSFSLTPQDRKFLETL